MSDGHILPVIFDRSVKADRLFLLGAQDQQGDAVAATSCLNVHGAISQKSRG